MAVLQGGHYCATMLHSQLPSLLTGDGLVQNSGCYCGQNYKKLVYNV